VQYPPRFRFHWLFKLLCAHAPSIGQLADLYRVCRRVVSESGQVRYRELVSVPERFQSTVGTEEIRVRREASTSLNHVCAMRGRGPEDGRTSRQQTEDFAQAEYDATTGA
jgi:hypothetical protein